MKDEGFHRPVLLKETIEALRVRKGKKYIDATIGGGGHTKEILKRGGIVLGIDCDPETIEILKSPLREFLTETKNKKVKTQIKKDAIRNCYSRKERDKKLILTWGNFRDLKEIAYRHGFTKVAGVLFDLGLSSWQIEKSGRGFSYLKDEPLDMRMDPAFGLTAADLINNLSKEELDEIFARFGEEVDSRAIANAIVSTRPIKTTGKLAEVVGKDNRRLARVFQALRIVVNDELDNLKTALPQAVGLLEKGGRLVVISFHSLEDRVVKFGLRDKNLKIITKKPIRPSKEEIWANSRARSARLRVAERI